MLRENTTRRKARRNGGDKAAMRCGRGVGDCGCMVSADKEPLREKHSQHGHES